MRAFTFHIDQLDQDPLIKSRSLLDDAEAVAYARQLLKDWPDCRSIDIIDADELVDRLRPSRAQAAL